MVAAVHKASAIVAYRHIFSEPFPTEEAAASWRAYDGLLVLATHDGEPVGFAAWRERMLDALYILPEHVGRGLGTQLLDALPASVDSLWVLVDNARARAFYEKHGWSGTGVVRSAYGSVSETLYRR